MDFSRRVAISLAVPGLCLLVACRENITYDPQLDEDAITHLAARPADAADDVWVRIGEPDAVCRFEELLRRAAPMPPLADERKTGDSTARFFVKWKSGREAYGCVGPDNVLRFWHLAIPLTDDDDAFLKGLIESVRGGVTSWPGGVPRPARPEDAPVVTAGR